jgi:hypothetical protein
MKFKVYEYVSTGLDEHEVVSEYGEYNSPQWADWVCSHLNRRLGIEMDEDGWFMVEENQHFYVVE